LARERVAGASGGRLLRGPGHQILVSAGALHRGRRRPGADHGLGREEVLGPDPRRAAVRPADRPGAQFSAVYAGSWGATPAQPGGAALPLRRSAPQWRTGHPGRHQSRHRLSRQSTGFSANGTQPERRILQGPAMLDLGCAGFGRRSWPWRRPCI
ncbi:unnamed protein product, partial [Prorocentrum cordatum]